ncbi:hypothetical protein VTK56DRAFT_5244 [Thermocarpiscus australiensis]
MLGGARAEAAGEEPMAVSERNRYTGHSASGSRAGCCANLKSLAAATATETTPCLLHSATTRNRAIPLDVVRRQTRWRRPGPTWSLTTLRILSTGLSPSLIGPQFGPLPQVQRRSCRRLLDRDGVCWAFSAPRHMGFSLGPYSSFSIFCWLHGSQQKEGGRGWGAGTGCYQGTLALDLWCLAEGLDSLVLRGPGLDGGGGRERCYGEQVHFMRIYSRWACRFRELSVACTL